MRYFIELAYRGTHYHGWQIQPNAPSVQEKIEEGLSLILKNPTSIMGSGRTDTGVHCREQFAHFDSPKALDTEHLGYRLNAFLPADILIKRIFPVPETLHARFSATERRYEYLLSRTKDPFRIGLSARYWKPLDVQAMQEAATKLTDYEDFKAFSKVKTQVRHFRCDVKSAYWEITPDLWVFHIRANRFLRGMVRAVVGTLLEVGSGKISVADFCRIIESGDRRKAGAAAPPEGLYLVEVTYPEGSWS